MSYIEFRDEVMELLEKWYESPQRDQRTTGVANRVISPLLGLGDDRWVYFLEKGDDAESAVLDQWLAAKRFDGVIAFAISNFDTTGGDEFIRKISRALEARGDRRRVRKLWKGILANRMRHFGGPTPDRTDLEPRRAEARESVIAAMVEFAEIMERLGDDRESIRLRRDLALFRAGKRRRSKRAPDKRVMEEEVFWEIIDEARRRADSPADQAEVVVEQLEAFGLRAIRRFQKILDSKMASSYNWDLWALAYIVRRGCSDDAFDYFRAWLILQGRAVFEAAVRDIAALERDGSGLDPQCEELLYAAEQAYENKKGEPMKPLAPQKRELQGDEWAEDEIEDRFPKICASHGW